MINKLIVIEPTIMRGQSEITCECNEDDIEKTIKKLIQYSEIFGNDIDEEEIDDYINKITIYTIKNKKTFEPTNIVKEIIKENEEYEKEREEDEQAKRRKKELAVYEKIKKEKENE